MSSLTERLEAHARLHDAFYPPDEEQTQWAADLREAIDAICERDELARQRGELAARVIELQEAMCGAPREADAQRMGEVGGTVCDSERLAFEAWMRGHCWALCATWDGKQYRSDAEHCGWVDARAMVTRQLWAAWRDRAALAKASRTMSVASDSQPSEMPR